MNLKLNLTKIELNNFLINNPLPQFLQSWQWGEFQKSLGKNVWRFGVSENNQLITVCQLIEQKLPWSKSYFYSPRGPVLANQLNLEQKEQIFKIILKEVRDVTDETKTREEIFLKIEPPLVHNLFNFKNLGLNKVKAVQPKDTLIINLQEEIPKLLEKMHPKTRYNIKLAEKKGINIKVGTINDFETFWWLIKKTSKRGDFKPHPKNYYQKILQVLAPSDKFSKDNFFVELWLAEFKNKPIAAVLIGYFGDIVTYLHGGSDYKFHNLMAPHLLHWQIIQDAKKRDYQYYDFWGIAPQNVKNEQPGWDGLTRFKRGFGGEEINYAGTFDFIYDQFWYTLYNVAKKFI